MNKASLNAAIKRHSHLIEEGKTLDEIMEAIRADDKDFDEEGVQEIYAAMTSGDKKSDDKKSDGKKFVVVKSFRDINDFKKEHKPGHDVSHFDSERLKKLVDNGHVKEK